MTSAAASTTEEQVQTDSSYNAFIGSIRSQKSKVVYADAIKYFIRFLCLSEYFQLLDKAGQPRLIEADILAYIKYLKETRKVAPATLDLYVVGAIKVFYDANDVEGIRWSLRFNLRSSSVFMCMTFLTP